MSFFNSRKFRVVDSNIINTQGKNNRIHIGDNHYTYRDRGPSNNEQGLTTLSSKVAFQALHDAEARYPQPNVLQGTRKKIMQKLSRWVEDSSERKNRVFWVNGAAGVGKSAIAQALSEKYIQSGKLAAAFFFSRNDSTRDKLDPFIATIIHQLVTSLALKPRFAPLIEHTIRSTPGIFHKQWEYQFRVLIQEPCAQVDPRRWTRLPRLVIIDGLDECIDVDSQKRLLKTIQAATSTLPLDFLIFSRPEPHITHAFRQKSFRPPYRLALGDFAVEKDIERYLRHEFARLREEYWAMLPHPRDTWPGDEVVMILLRKATGQFIYVTTVVKFVGTGKIPVTPMQRLQVILQSSRVLNLSSPYPDLDQLYTQILQFCVNEGQKLQRVLQLVVSPIGSHHVLKAPFRLRGSPEVGLRSTFAMEQLLDLSPGEAMGLLSGLHSILNIPDNHTDDVAVTHASFTDFLTDPHRSGVYYVGSQLSDNGWTQMFTPCHLRILLRFIAGPKDTTHERPLNGIQDADIGSLNAWKYLHDNFEVVTTRITDEIISLLNEFDPHLYLTTLLHWDYEVSRKRKYDAGGVEIRNDELVFMVSHFEAGVGLQHDQRDWRHRAIAIHCQISMLYSVFYSLRELPSSTGMQRFFKNCISFFRGFFVTFPKGQHDQSVRFSALACQLSLSRLDPEFPRAQLSTFIAKLNPILGHHDTTLSVIPFDPDPKTWQVPWEIKYIGRLEGCLLRKLLEILVSSIKPSAIVDIFRTEEFETWTYKLARLRWEQTRGTYLSMRDVKAVFREGPRIGLPQVEDAQSDSGMDHSTCIF